MGAYKYKVKRGNRGIAWRFQFEYRGQQFGRRGFEREADAKAAEAVKRAEVAQGIAAGGPSPLLEDFLQDQFLSRRKAMMLRGELRSSTYAQDERDVRLHITPAFGSRNLREMLDIEAIERWQDAKALTLSHDTVIRFVNTLSLAMKLARRYRLIPYNPVSDVEKLKPHRRTPDLPSLSDIQRLSSTMPTLETRAIPFFAASTGVRKSECFALRWANLDLTPGLESALIVEQYYKGELVPITKTQAGMREIIIPPLLARILRELSVAQQLDGRPNPKGLVFPSPNGCYWLDTNFDRRVWAKAREAAGLPGLTFQTLRYFYVSHVRAQGLPISVSEQLTGHVDDRTHRGYTRPIPGMEPVIREALGKAFPMEAT